jgi:hypothetical protein
MKQFFDILNEAAGDCIFAALGVVIWLFLTGIFAAAALFLYSLVRA